MRDNIRYGKLEANDAEVEHAAERARAHEFIREIPSGYAALVGERGVKRAGGQRQRIAIARVLLKNAPVLILDEATSSLDSITERAIQDVLDDAMTGKTVVVIAHRLSTIAHLDRILVFSEGRIVEDGSHAELLARDGVYSELWGAGNPEDSCPITQRTRASRRSDTALLTADHTAVCTALAAQLWAYAPRHTLCERFVTRSDAGLERSASAMLTATIAT